MPLKPRKARKRRQRLTGRQIEHLIYGWALGGTLDSPVPPFESEEHRRQCWEDNRDYILSLEGVERVPGVFGCVPLKKGEKPQAMLDYEGRK